MKVLVTLILFISPVLVFSQSCEQCKERNIIVYDNKVSVPAPDLSLPPQELITKLGEWQNLFYIAGGVKNYVWNDPTSDCFRKFAAAFFTESDSINDRIKWGADHANVPPEGPIAGIALYIIYGTVTGTEGAYTLQLNLETGRSRELVKTVSINFSSGFNPFEVGENTAKQFGVLYNTVMEFEKKKRDEGDPYAIRPQIKTTASKSILMENESADIEFTLTDCDDVPLKNRTIELSAVNGSFDVQTVTTDASGKAGARFTAGNNPGMAKVNGLFQYKMPTELSGMSATDGGDACIQIKEQPYWEVTVNYAFEENSYFTQDLGAGQVNREIVRKHSGDLFGYIDQNSFGNGIYNTNRTVMSSVIGEYSHSYYERQQTSTKDENSSAYSNSVTSGFWNGDGHQDEQEINVSISKNGNHFSFTNIVTGMKGGGQTNSISVICQDGNCFSSNNFSLMDDPTIVVGEGTHPYDTPKSDQDTTYETVNTPFPGYTFTTKVNQIFQKRPTGYFLSYSGTETSEIQQGFSTSVTTLKEEVIFEVNTGITTDVKNDEMLPENYLFQNSPNPFNPETIIRYALNKPGYVKLIVYDLLGKEAKVLINSYQNAGSHFARFNGSNLNSGVYIYKLETAGFVSAKKMLLVK